MKKANKFSQYNKKVSAGIQHKAQPGNSHYRKSLANRFADSWSQDGTAWGLPSVGGRDRTTLVERGQYLDRNSPFAKSLLNTAAKHIVGPKGFTLSLKCEDPEWIYRTESAFKTWIRTAELSGCSWYEAQIGVCRNMLRDGDLGVMLSKDSAPNDDRGGFQLIVNNRIISPSDKDKTIVDGVEVDECGRPIAFYVNVAEYPDVKCKRVRSQYFLFPRLKQEINDIRGAGSFWNFYEIFEQMHNYLRATVKQAVAQGKTAIAITKNGPVNSTDGYAEDDNGESKIVEMDDGLIYYLEPNENIQMLKNEVVALNHGGFIHEMSRLMATCLGMPVELMNFENTTYSGGQSAGQEARLTFEHYQQLLMDSFYIPLVCWWISKGQEEGWLDYPANSQGSTVPFEVSFIPPMFRYQNRVESVTAQLAEYSAGFTTFRSICNNNGLDYERHLEELQQERKDLENAGIVIPKSTLVQQTQPAAQ